MMNETQDLRVRLGLCLAHYFCWPRRQSPPRKTISHLRVNVDLVQLNIAVTDSKGNYIADLKPENFVITEDKIPQKIATFEEGKARITARAKAPPRSAETESGTRTFRGH